MRRHTGVEIKLTFFVACIGLFPKSSSYSLKKSKEKLLSYMVRLFVCFLLGGGGLYTLLYGEITTCHLTKRHTDVLTNDACVKRRTALMGVYFANVPVFA